MHFIALWFSTKFVFFLVYLKFNLSNTIYFLKSTWFLFVLSKYHGMFEILQWNAMLWDISYSINSNVIRYLQMYMSFMKTSIKYYNTIKSNQMWAKNNPDMLTFDYQFYLCHCIKYFSRYNKATAGTFSLTVYVLRSDWWIGVYIPKEQKTCFSNHFWPRINVQTPRYLLGDF